RPPTNAASAAVAESATAPSLSPGATLTAVGLHAGARLPPPPRPPRAARPRARCPPRRPRPRAPHAGPNPPRAPPRATPCGGPGPARSRRLGNGEGEVSLDGDDGGCHGSRGKGARRRDQHGILLTGLFSTHEIPPGGAKVQRLLD